jgi:hypothetical protein
MNKQSKMLEILDDTVKYYSEDTDRRAVLYSGTCAYQDADGNKCAIGRYLSQKDMERIRLDYDLSTPLDGPCGIWDKITTAKIKSLSFAFWIALQSFHDANRNWTKNGISKRGLQRARGIKNMILKGKFE